MRRYLAFTLIALVVLVFAISCSTPYKMSEPAPMPVPAPMPPPPEIKKKMCVGRDCKYLGAADVTGTTRGHTNDEED